jgi:hypothetical protein
MWPRRRRVGWSPADGPYQSVQRSGHGRRVASLSGVVFMVVSSRVEQSFWQLLNKGLDLVAHAHVMAQGFLGALGRGGKPWRVVKAAMDDPGAAGENRTGFMGITTNKFQAVYGRFLASSSAIIRSQPHDNRA